MAQKKMDLRIIFVLFLAKALLLAMMFYTFTVIVPEQESYFIALDSQLPTLTQYCISMSNLFKAQYIFVFVAILIELIISLVLSLKVRSQKFILSLYTFSIVLLSLIVIFTYVAIRLPWNNLDQSWERSMSQRGMQANIGK